MQGFLRMNTFINKWHITASICLSGDLTSASFKVCFDFALICSSDNVFVHLTMCFW